MRNSGTFCCNPIVGWLTLPTSIQSAPCFISFHLVFYRRFYSPAQLVHIVRGVTPQKTFWTSHGHRCLPFFPPTPAFISIAHMVLSAFPLCQLLVLTDFHRIIVSKKFAALVVGIRAVRLAHAVVCRRNACCRCRTAVPVRCFTTEVKVTRDADDDNIW